MIKKNFGAIRKAAPVLAALALCFRPATAQEIGLARVPNGDFESWEIRRDGVGAWNLSNGSFPNEWEPSFRPRETGFLRRVEHPEDTREQFGQYSLYLDGRIIMKAPLTNLRDKTLQLSFWARGENGSLQLRLFQYTQPTAETIDYIAKVLDVDTETEWRQYTALVKMVPYHGASFAKLEFLGSGVVLDEVRWQSIDPMAGRTDAAFKGAITVPRAAVPVVIDGRLEADEWSNAVGVDGGFMSIIRNSLIDRQTDIRLTSDVENLYIAAIFDRRAGGFKNNVTERDGKVYTDESLEVFINPEFTTSDSPSVVYQIVINVGGTIFDMAQQLTMGQNQLEWNCKDLVVAKSTRDGRRILEIGIPLASVGLQQGQDFGLNLCRNLYYPTDWSSLTGKGYKDYKSMFRTALVPEGIAVQWGYGGDLRAGEVGLNARLLNSGGEPRACEVELKIGAGNEALVKKSLTLNAGEQTTMSLPAGEKPILSEDFFVTVKEQEHTVLHQTLRFDRETFHEETAPEAQSRNTGIVETYPVQKKLNLRLPDVSSRLENLPGHAYGKTSVAIYSGTDALESECVYRSECGTPIITGESASIVVPYFPDTPGSYLVQGIVEDSKGNVAEIIGDTFEVKDIPWYGNGKGNERVPLN